jgi:hypothetical protein
MGKLSNRGVIFGVCRFQGLEKVATFCQTLNLRWHARSGRVERGKHSGRGPWWTLEQTKQTPRGKLTGLTGWTGSIGSNGGCGRVGTGFFVGWVAGWLDWFAGYSWEVVPRCRSD